MLENLFDCFYSIKVSIILIICFILYLYKSKRDELNKTKEQHIIDSIDRRSKECPQLYPNGWLPVLDSHDLEKGEVKSIFTLGHDLVIYRGTSGKVYVFDAYCPHLGANLGVGGTVVGDDIKCHFHGWQFDNQGDCRSIPGLDDNSIPKASIRKWRCDEVNDFIYVWHHLDGNDPDWFIPKKDELERFTYCGRVSRKIYSHIQDIVENEADDAHFDKIHTTEHTVSKYLKSVIEIKFWRQFWRNCLPPLPTHCSDTQSRASVKIFFLTLPTIIVDFRENGPANLIFEVHFESLIDLKFIGNLNIISFGPNKHQLSVNWYSEPSILGYILGRVFLYCFGPLLDPDVPVWNHKCFRNKPVYTKLDKDIITYRRWYKQEFYSKN